MILFATNRSNYKAKSWPAEEFCNFSFNLYGLSFLSVIDYAEVFSTLLSHI